MPSKSSKSKTKKSSKKKNNKKNVPSNEPKPNVSFKLKCPECKGTKLRKDTSHGEIVCDDCGLVIEEDLIQLIFKQFLVLS